MTSDVYLASNLNDPTINIAIKIFKDKYLKENEDAHEYIQNEINVMTKINNPNIIEFFDYGFDGEMLYQDTNQILTD